MYNVYDLLNFDGLTYGPLRMFPSTSYNGRISLVDRVIGLSGIVRVGRLIALLILFKNALTERGQSGSLHMLKTMSKYSGSGISL